MRRRCASGGAVRAHRKGFACWAGSPIAVSAVCADRCADGRGCIPICHMRTTLVHFTAPMACGAAQHPDHGQSCIFDCLMRAPLAILNRAPAAERDQGLHHVCPGPPDRGARQTDTIDHVMTCLRFCLNGTVCATNLGFLIRIGDFVQKQNQ